MKDDQYIIVFESCKLSRGKTKSLFIDLQRNSYRIIPNQIADLVTFAHKRKLSDIKRQYKNEYDEVIEENFALLEKEEFIFFTENPEWFPAMSLEWDEPTILTNGIIDIEPNNVHEFERIWNQLSDLGCEHIQIRSFNAINLSTIDKMMALIIDKRIVSVEFIIPYNKVIDDQEYIDLVYKYPRIFTLYLHSANLDETIFQSPTGMGHVMKSKQKISDKTHCGNIGQDQFVINTKAYTESLHHNSCLNRKISIDTEGNIKNCPSMSESYGNIKDTTLAEAIEKPGFKKYWDINKDKIHVCKDCEFRYICTDCRAYVEDPEDIYSKPLKCGYNPYTGEWSEWSTNPLKQKAIDFYGMREMVEDMNDES